LLGTGGFAVVWLAYDDRLEDHVAIKVLAENWAERLDVRARFEREARLLRRSNSHRVVDVYDIDELPDGRPYFVMTYADQGNLADRLVAGPLAASLALRYGADIARGVADLHRAGVLHRDIKPSNVLFRSVNTPGEPALLIADLGLSREIARGSRLTMAVGTPGYMAPEQNDPDRVIDERVDVYGVGATVYHALTGQPPAEPLVAPSSRSQGLPAGTDAVVLRALARDPDERWESAEAFAAALDDLDAPAAIDGSSPGEPVRVPSPTLPLPPRRRVLVLVALVVVLIVGGAYAAVQFGPPFASGNVGADSGSTAEPEVGGGDVSPSPTSRLESVPSTPGRPPVTEVPPSTVTVTTSRTSAVPAQPVPSAPCSHARGDGIVIAAAPLQTTTSPPAKIGSVRLCRDASYQYWASMVRYQSLPAGQWVNGTLDRWVDGHFSARFSCAATASGASGVVTAGLHECWTPKVPGTDPTLTFYAFAEQCDGVYDDKTRCTAKGNTTRTR
jgi:serine/threonine protein kinase